ncbi:hypothetical protein E2C01_005316 [Portunus trituberculatus]|uniref:Uncharacterized protein n=1 Tax=Portunus trituberculatus TaxID=210409 RepID=A0A5B7CYV0_PORTR|nr:hypothetical protein [Portunus trituberculatus]
MKMGSEYVKTFKSFHPKRNEVTSSVKGWDDRVVAIKGGGDERRGGERRRKGDVNMKKKEEKEEIYEEGEGRGQEGGGER